LEGGRGQVFDAYYFVSLGKGSVAYTLHLLFILFALALRKALFLIVYIFHGFMLCCVDNYFNFSS
jgi:hypothetical protein